ncbi:MAG: hypothetical protein HYV24_02490 [Deltaproteobacteria bacterium]|nr:hypothetical protein [Deltaproteobacteria bacterium]
MTGRSDGRPVSVQVRPQLTGQLFGTVSAKIEIDPLAPIALYHFNNSWIDSSGNGYNATTYGGAAFDTNAKAGSHSANFNGTSSYLGIKSSALIANNSQSTLEAWVYPSSTCQQNRTLYSENIDVGAVFMLTLNCSGYASFNIWRTDIAGNWVSVTSGTALTSNSWSHVAATLDSSGMKIFVNGSLAGTNASNTLPSNGSIIEVDIGKVKNDGGRDFFNGLVDEVTIYDRALSASEILAHAQIDTTAPAKPTVNTVSRTRTAEITLSGTKESYSSILINGIQAVSVDQSTTWTVSYTLQQQGVNNLSITSKDSTGNQSPAENISVTWDNTAPTVSGSSPSNNSSTNTSVNSVTISLVDSYSPVDLSATITGAIVKDSLNQSVAGSWSTAGTNTVTFTPQTAFADGTYTVIINPTDDLGNTSTAQIVFSYDTTAPPAPGINAVVSPTNATSQTLSGTRGADTASIIVTSSAGTVGTVAYPSASTWSAGISGLVEGFNTINVYALDSAGNQSGATAVIAVDTTPPAPPVMDAISSPTVSSVLALTGSKETNSFIYVNGVKAPAQYVANAWTYTVSLNEGGNSFNIYAQDELGNQSQHVTVSVVRDTTAPYISSSIPSANVFINQSSNIEITLADAYSAVNLQGSLSGATVVNSSGQSVSGNWSVSGAKLIFSPSTAFANSIYTVAVHPVDSLGNTGLATFTFTVDTTAPVAQSVTMTPASPHKAETVSFTINFNESMLMGVQPDVSFSRGFLYGSYAVVGSWVDSRNWQGNFIFNSNTGDGTYTISVSSAKDLAQNVMSSLDIGTFVLDTAAPSAPVISPVTTPTKNAYQAIGGSKDPETAIFVDGTQRVSLNSSGSWSYDYPLKEGSNSISVVARDETGNDSTAAAASIVLDTTPPAFSITGYQNPSPSATQQISGTREAGAVIKLNNSVIIDSTDLNTTWAYTATLTDGITNRLMFVATDALGNSITKSIDILYDTSAPEPMPDGVLTAVGSGKGTEVTLSWSGFTEPQDIAYYKIYYSASDFSSVAGHTPAGTVNKGTYSFKVSGLVKGTQYYFAVVPVDNSGNYNASVYTAGAIPADTIAPEEVSGLTAQAGYGAVNGNYVNLNWSPSANSAGDLSEQVIYFDSGLGYDNGTPVGSSAVSFTKTGLTDATKYKFRISTKDTGGHESVGTVIEAMTRLDNPAGLGASPGNAKINLSWNPVNSAYVKEYRVYRSGSPITDVSGMTPLKSLSGTSFTDTGVVNGNTYHYAATVLNTSGAERTSVQSISSAPRQDETGPSISGLNLASNQVVTSPLTITASAQDSESQMDRLEVYVDSVLAKTQSGSSISFYWNILDTADGNHGIKVDAYDSLGNSTSVTVPVIVSAAPPSAPAISTHSVVQTAPSYIVNIPGTAPLHTTVTLKVNGAVWGQTSTGVDGTFSFNSVSLVEGDNLISAKASHRGGESVFFSPDYVIVVDSGAPNAPVNLSAKALTGGTVQFTWQSGTGEIPSGYNVYAGASSFTSKNDAGVVKINSASIPFQYTEYAPVDDTLRHYAVTALDSSGNESGLSSLISIASDGTLPAVASVRFSYTDQSGNTTDPASTAGPGKVKASVESTESLSELPFFSLEPQSGSPVVFTLKKIDETHFEGTINVNALTPHGSTIYKFSAKDVVGNRGNSQGSGISVDVQGPFASITSPVSAVQKGASVGVTVSFNEAPANTPAISISDGINNTVQVSSLASSDGLIWTGLADLSNLNEGTLQFSLNDVTDRFGNISSTIASGGSIVLYGSTPPAPAVPANLTATARMGRGVGLTWTTVADAESYKIYRRAGGETPVPAATAAKGAGSAGVTAPADGVYYFSISSVGLLDSESQRSAEVSVTADGTAPSSPAGPALSLDGNGVTASWTSIDGAASYKVYRSNASITDIAGFTPVATSTTPSAVDPAPTSSIRFYAVTALDALGNESAPSQSSEIVFPVAPPQDLVLSKIDNGKPTLTWASSESNLQGYHVYRNGSRITQTPTPTASYTDSYYSGGTATYGISQVDGFGNESPVKEVTLYDISIGLKEGTTLRRGVLETVQVVLSSSANLTVSSIEMKIGSSQSNSLSGPFTLVAGNGLTVEKVAATEANAAEQVAVVTTAVMTSSGATVRVQKSSLANVLGSGTALEIFNDPLVKGGQAKIKLKVNNLGSAQTEFLTSRNNGPTSEVKVMLKDQDGNLLGQGYLNQRTGNVVNSGNYALARLSPGENILTEPVTFDVPASAPYKVVIEAEIQNTYYNYNQSGMVTAPGFRQSIETTMAETSYTASASVAKTVYKQGEAVTITGQAVSTSAGTPMPLVSVKLGISVKGFDRSYTLSTDEQGNFSYTFTPGSNEAGTYSIWAVHPDVSSRTVQAQFNVVGLEMTPTFAEINISKNSTYDIPVTLKNISDVSLSGVSFTATASSGLTASAVNAGGSVMAPNETRSLTFRVSSASNAPETGYAALNVSAVVGADTVSSALSANVNLTQAVPVIKTSPSYIDTGVVNGKQKVESFTISNTGLDALKNARIEGPFLSWVSLTIDKTLGDIPSGSSKSVGLLIKPADTLAQGIYDDRIVIYSDNHIAYTFNIQVTVTSNAVGNVMFDVLNELMQDVSGATITMQNQSLTELIYTAKTGADGTVSIYDVPEGRYSFNVTASGHKSYSGSISVVSGLTVVAPIALEANLIEVEWSVEQTTIEDSYEITISQTFETDVPTAVLVVEPASVTVPDIQPGEVFNGEFTITNYGLISANYQGLDIPTSAGDYDIEVLATFPATIGAMQKVTVPYRITRRQQ